MHFSKTYTQLLLNLPPDLRQNAVQYRQLKKLINQVVLELTALGLSPDVLQDLLENDGSGRAVYEFVDGGELRLRFSPGGEQVGKIVEMSDADDDPKSLFWALQSKNSPITTTNEIIVSLPSDSAFFQLLSSALHGVTSHLSTVRSDFLDFLSDLARDIGDSARPVSQANTDDFKPYSAITTHPGNLRVRAIGGEKTDLYTWRSIFQLYVESEVFASLHEMDRGERSVDEAETRLKQFVERVSQRGLDLKMKKSKKALDSFLELNLVILNVKKFQQANAEATRKILKKHAKRTALPLPDQVPNNTLIITLPTSLPLMLVQSISEVLLPVIPSLDDYSCLICGDIAFKPIRLTCRHLFCVRCLVKMQKRGQGDCPMCRAPTVITADRSNVDWGLLNFMQDWFPIEAREKLKQNEREAAEEQLIELGIEISSLGRAGGGCIIM